MYLLLFKVVQRHLYPENKASLLTWFITQHLETQLLNSRSRFFMSSRDFLSAPTLSLWCFYLCIKHNIFLLLLPRSCFYWSLSVTLLIVSSTIVFLYWSHQYVVEFGSFFWHLFLKLAWLAFHFGNGRFWVVDLCLEFDKSKNGKGRAHIAVIAQQNRVEAV